MVFLQKGPSKFCFNVRPFVLSFRRSNTVVFSDVVNSTLERRRPTFLTHFGHIITDGCFSRVKKWRNRLSRSNSNNKSNSNSKTWLFSHSEPEENEEKLPRPFFSLSAFLFWETSRRIRFDAPAESGARQNPTCRTLVATKIWCDLVLRLTTLLHCSGH